MDKIYDFSVNQILFEYKLKGRGKEYYIEGAVFEYKLTGGGKEY